MSDEFGLRINSHVVNTFINTGEKTDKMCEK